MLLKKIIVLVPFVAVLLFSAPVVFAEDAVVDCSVCDSQDPLFNAATCSSVKAQCSSALLPLCARTRRGCTQLSDIAITAINYGRFIFGIAGAAALLFVVYGGGKMLFSFGSGESIEAGKRTLTSAIIGLVIIFSAYLIVAFVIQALGVKSVSTFGDLLPL